MFSPGDAKAPPKDGEQKGGGGKDCTELLRGVLNSLSSSEEGEIMTQSVVSFPEILH